MDTLLQKDCPIEGKWNCQPRNEKMIRIKAAQLIGAMDNEIEQASLEFASYIMELQKSKELALQNNINLIKD